MCSYSSDVEFRAFLVVLLVWSFNADGLDGGKANGSCFIWGAVNIFDGKRVFQGSKHEFVFLGKGGVDNHSFGTTIKEGRGNDFLLRLSSDEEYSERDRRSSYISYSFFRYRLRV